MGGEFDFLKVKSTPFPHPCPGGVSGGQY